jgi:hypothetical protein
MRLPLQFSLLLAGLSLTAAVARAQVVDCVSVRDNTLFQTSDGSLSDGSGPVFFAGDAGLVPRRGLIRFDVAGAIPPGSLITGATLTLNLSQAPNANAVPMELHRVTADWGEGTSSTSAGGGAPSAAGDATWIHAFFPGTPWASAGGDFAAAASASRTVTGVGSYAWTSAGMVADVQSWLDAPANDYGWLVLGDEVGNNTARRFDSRENATPANRPRLTITYTAPTPARTTSWSAIKALYR